MIKALKRAHPFVVFTYFTGMFLLAPFSRHPWMTGVQMICLCLLYFYHNRSLKKFFPLIALILIVAVTNPLFVQRGGTILYADTHIRITKEALLYGIHYGCVLVNLLPLGSSSFFKCLNNVVFPLPLGPAIRVIFPFLIFNDTCSREFLSDNIYRNVKLLISYIKILLPHAW